MAGTLQTTKPSSTVAPVAGALLKQLKADEDDRTYTMRNFFSDESITEKVYRLHHSDDKQIDVPAYIVHFRTLLARANLLIENALTKTTGGYLEKTTPLVGSNINPSDVPICLLHQLSCEMRCKPTGIQSAHDTTISILDKLNAYPYDAKAMLTFAAFGTDYGESLHLLHPTDDLARLLGVVKGLPVLKRNLETRTRRGIDLHRSLMLACLDVIKDLNDLKGVSRVHVQDTRVGTELSHITGKIPTYTYWVIHTVVALRIEITSYTTDGEGQQVNYLEDLAEKQASIRRELGRFLNIFIKQQAELELFRWLVQHIEQIPTEITIVFDRLIYAPNNRKFLIDGSTRTEVGINVLEDKDILLVISGLHISDYEIDILRHVYNETRKTNKFKIVWVPIKLYSEYQDPQKRFDEFIYEMPWYSVPFSAEIPGYKYVEEKWLLREDPLVVVLNAQSKVQSPNAFHLIQVFKHEAIPFTRDQTLLLLGRKNWIELTFFQVFDIPELRTWISQEQLIIFYGAKEEDTTRLDDEFEKRVLPFNNITVLKTEFKISVEPVRIGKSSTGLAYRDGKIISTDRLWSLLWSLFIVKKEVDDPKGTQDILKLLFYRSEDPSNWAVLIKGSQPVITCRWNVMLDALENFELWKENVRRGQFTDAIKSYIYDQTRVPKQCDSLAVPGQISGLFPQSIHCPECGDRFLDVGYVFKCCHGTQYDKYV